MGEVSQKPAPQFYILHFSFYIPHAIRLANFTRPIIFPRFFERYFNFASPKIPAIRTVIFTPFARNINFFPHRFFSSQAHCRKDADKIIKCYAKFHNEL
jgi:hypothetical protein